MDAAARVKLTHLEHRNMTLPGVVLRGLDIAGLRRRGGVSFCAREFLLYRVTRVLVVCEKKDDPKRRANGDGGRAFQFLGFACLAFVVAYSGHSMNQSDQCLRRGQPEQPPNFR